MYLYEIQQNIKNLCDELVDEETGKIRDEIYAELMCMTEKKKEKDENIALYIKNKINLINGIESEIKNLQERKRRENNHLIRLKEMLSSSLLYQNFETPKVKISFRKSTRVKVDDKFIDFAKKEGYMDLVKTKLTETVDKAALKKRLQNGEEINYCSLEEQQNIQIK